MQAAEKTGVYICECGPNIKDAIDVHDVVKFVQGLENVVLAKPLRLLCSEEGKELIGKDIKELNQGGDRGCDAFIQKPFTMKELSGKIREVLEKK